MESEPSASSSSDDSDSDYAEGIRTTIKEAKQPRGAGAPKRAARTADKNAKGNIPKTAEQRNAALQAKMDVLLEENCILRAGRDGLLKFTTQMRSMAPDGKLSDKVVMDAYTGIMEKSAHKEKLATANDRLAEANALVDLAQGELNSYKADHESLIESLRTTHPDFDISAYTLQLKVPQAKPPSSEKVQSNVELQATVKRLEKKLTGVEKKLEEAHFTLDAVRADRDRLIKSAGDHRTVPERAIVVVNPTPADQVARKVHSGDCTKCKDMDVYISKLLTTIRELEFRIVDNHNRTVEREAYVQSMLHGLNRVSQSSILDANKMANGKIMLDDCQSFQSPRDDVAEMRPDLQANLDQVDKIPVIRAPYNAILTPEIPKSAKQVSKKRKGGGEIPAVPTFDANPNGATVRTRRRTYTTSEETITTTTTAITAVEESTVNHDTGPSVHVDVSSTSQQTESRTTVETTVKTTEIQQSRASFTSSSSFALYLDGLIASIQSSRDGNASIPSSKDGNRGLLASIPSSVDGNRRDPEGYGVGEDIYVLEKPKSALEAAPNPEAAAAPNPEAAAAPNPEAAAPNPEAPPPSKGQCTTYSALGLAPP
jgi:hypothetical protein